jgi:hypothetical protein
MCSPSVKAIVAPSSTTWVPYLTERLFALAMTAADVSAMGISNVECATPHVQSKSDIHARVFELLSQAPE